MTIVCCWCWLLEVLRQLSHGTPHLSILIITPVPPGLNADGSMERPVSMGGAARVSVLRALQTELDTGQFCPGRPVLPSCLTAFCWLCLSVGLAGKSLVFSPSPSLPCFRCCHVSTVLLALLFFFFPPLHSKLLRVHVFELLTFSSWVVFLSVLS